jgi:hypothetical protein
MVGKKDGFYKKLFLIAAIYDLFLGIIFLTLYKPIYSYLNIALPTYPMYLQLSAAFVIAIGMAYYYIYKNLYRNIDLVKLGIIYKVIYTSLAAYYYFVGVAHTIFLWFAIFDIVFLIFFIRFLSYVKKDKRFLK